MQLTACICYQCKQAGLTRFDEVVMATSMMINVYSTHVWGEMRGFGGGRAPKARAESSAAVETGWGVRRGCPTEGGVWGGSSTPSPENFFDFGLQKATFIVII